MGSNQHAEYNYKAKLKGIQNNFLNITGVTVLMVLDMIQHLYACANV